MSLFNLLVVVYINKLAFWRCLPLDKMWNMIQYRAVASGIVTFYCCILQSGDMDRLLLLGHNWRWYLKMGAMHSSPVCCGLLPAKVDQFPCTFATNGGTAELTKYTKPCPWHQCFGVITLSPLKVLTERLQEGGSSGEVKPSTTTTSLYAVKQVQENRTSLFYSWLMMMTMMMMTSSSSLLWRGPSEVLCWELPQLPPQGAFALMCWPKNWCHRSFETSATFFFFSVPF